MSDMNVTDTVAESDDSNKDSNGVCAALTNVERADMVGTHDVIVADEKDMRSGGTSTSVREVDTVNKDAQFQGDGIPIIGDGTLNFREASTLESEDLEGNNRTESVKCSDTIEVEDSAVHAEAKLRNAMESLSVGNVDVHRGEGVKSIAALESRESGTIEEDASLPNESSKDLSNREGITVEDDNLDLTTNQHLYQKQHSKLRTSDTVEDDSKSFIHKQISFEEEVFVPSTTYRGNMMGSLRKKMDSVTESREAETVDDSPFETYLSEVPQTLRTVPPNPAKIIFKVIQVTKSEHNKDSPIKGLPMEPLLKQAGEILIFGRGVGVDIYLQDLLASKQHLEVDVIPYPLRVTFKNISEKKPVLVNGTHRLQPTQSCYANNNDLVTIGCTTFLVELVQGDFAVNRYKVMFVNLTGEPSFIPSSVSSGGASQMSSPAVHTSHCLLGAQPSPNFDATYQPRPTQQYSYFQNTGRPLTPPISQPMHPSLYHLHSQAPTGYPFVGNAYISPPQYMPNYSFAVSPNQMQPMQLQGGYNMPPFAQNSSQQYVRSPPMGFGHSSSVPVQHDETSRAMQESETKWSVIP